MAGLMPAMHYVGARADCNRFWACAEFNNSTLAGPIWNRFESR